MKTDIENENRQTHTQKALCISLHKSHKYTVISDWQTHHQNRDMWQDQQVVEVHFAWMNILWELMWWE